MDEADAHERDRMSGESILSARTQNYPIAADNPRWMESGSCMSVDPELWFADMGGATRQAKLICQGCPVKVECLEYALENNERFGVWGGLSEHQRRPLRRRAA